MNMNCVTYEALVKEFGTNADKVWAQICEIGGFGQLSPLQATGGLAVGSLSDAKAKAAIEALLSKSGKTKA